MDKAWDDYEEKTKNHKGLVGLALSGGGIRSSTFNLGILQALNNVGLFRSIDYLSTVSGGGYIGSCLSSVFSGLKEEEDFPFKHTKNKPESSVFRHLRNNAEFLAPSGTMGILRMLGVLFRGIVINLAVVLIPILILAAGAANVAQWYYEHTWFGPADWNNHFGITMVFLIVILVLILLFPLFSWHHYKTKKDKDASDRGSRNFYEKSLGILIAATLITAFIELQPILIECILKFRQNNPSLTEWVLGIWGGGTGVGFITAGLKLNSLKKLREKLVAYIVSYSGIIFLWMAFLYLTCLAIENSVYLGIPSWLFYVILAIAALAYFNTYLNTNYTSVHNFYRDRLSKAYIIRQSREDETETNDDGIVSNDTLKLSSLNVPLNKTSPPPEPTADVETCDEIVNNQSPYHLINAALNSSNVPKKYQRGRHSDFFLFSKLYTGCEWTGYCDTDKLEELDAHVDLATAMAISGAAASPNMGRATNRGLAVILTILNIRLNYWLINPSWVAKERKYSLKFLRGLGPIYLFFEMFGILNYNSPMLNISDGGHIENLGVYQLLKRRCRLIIVGDGERDSNFEFQGLSEVIRMAMVDLGIKIDMEGLDDIREGEKAHAVGTIDYGNGCIGKLIYLKLSLCGDYNLEATLGSEAYLSSALRRDNRLYDRGPYLMHYKAKNPDFPHQSTGDQFFDEQQFEAYRALGVKVGLDALAR